MSELAKAYVQIIPTMEGVQGKLGELLGNEADSAGQSAGGNFAGMFGKALSGAGKVVAAGFAAMTGAVVAGGAAIVKGAGDVAAYGDNIDKMSQKMGLSIAAYQEWDAIMQHSGTSIESLQASMKTLANAVENDNAAFGRLGITQEQIASMNNEELFSATITALQNVKNETERTYLAGQLLGRGATELGALLNTSAEDTEAMRQRVHELGGVMSNEAVKAAAAYQDSLQDMQTAFGGLKNQLMSEFLPGITGVMDGLTDIFSGDSERGLGQISSGINSVISTISGKIPQFMELGQTILVSLATSITDNLPTLLTAGGKVILDLVNTGILPNMGQVVAVGLEVIVSLAQGIADSLPELVPTIVDVVLQIVDTLTNPDTLVALVEASLAIIIALAEGLIKVLPKLTEKAPVIVYNLIEAIIRAAPELLIAAAEMVMTLVQGIIDQYGAMIRTGGEIVDAVKNGFKAKVEQAKQWGKDLMQNFIDGITAKWQALKDSVSNVAQTIKNLIGFSEPKEGPLSNFHTYAPDMMELFAQGIKDKESIVKRQLEESFAFDEPTIGFASAVTSAGRHRFGAPGAGAYGVRSNQVVVNVYGAEGQSVDELARKVEQVITQSIARKEAAWA